MSDGVCSQGGVQLRNEKCGREARNQAESKNTGPSKSSWVLMQRSGDAATFCSDTALATASASRDIVDVMELRVLAIAGGRTCTGGCQHGGQRERRRADGAEERLIQPIFFRDEINREASVTSPYLVAVLSSTHYNCGGSHAERPPKPHGGSFMVVHGCSWLQDCVGGGEKQGSGEGGAGCGYCKRRTSMWLGTEALYVDVCMWVSPPSRRNDRERGRAGAMARGNTRARGRRRRREGVLSPAISDQVSSLDPEQEDRIERPEDRLSTEIWASGGRT